MSAAAMWPVGREYEDEGRDCYEAYAAEMGLTAAWEHLTNRERASFGKGAAAAIEPLIDQQPACEKCGEVLVCATCEGEPCCPVCGEMCVDCCERRYDAKGKANDPPVGDVPLHWRTQKQAERRLARMARQLGKEVRA